MKLLTAIFTRDKNLPYFKNCLKYWQVAKEKMLEKFPTFLSDLLVIDFSKKRSEEIEEITRKYNGLYNWRSEAGFGSNFNAAYFYADMTRYDVICLLNDDTAISDVFLWAGILFLRDGHRVGFIGGEETPGKWCKSLDEIKILPPKNLAYEMRNLHYLSWEFSACFLKTKAIKETGEFETALDPTGYLMDSEFLLRMRQVGWKIWHSGMLQYWHGKGITQAEYRIPQKGQPDPIREKAIRLIQDKWGVDITKPVAKLRYKTPYNSPERLPLQMTDLQELLRKTKSQ